MNFNSAAYALLVSVVLLLYYTLRRRSLQNLVLLAAGLFFYGAWDYRFLFLLMYSASVDYIGGLAIVGMRPTRRDGTVFVAAMTAATFLLVAPIDWPAVWTLIVPADAFAGGFADPSPWQGLFGSAPSWRNFIAACVALAVLGLTTVVGYRLPQSRQPKYFVVVSMTVNLALLGVFKYFDFFVGEAADLAALVGLGDRSWMLGIIVPAGISFYTFQAMSYTIDVYRGDLEPTPNFRDYLLFVSFFPHLVAGPIQQANWLLPQLRRDRVFNWVQAQSGVFLIAWGLFKKIFIADNLARFVAPGFEQGAVLTGPQVLFTLYAFALQIYGDFSAYSDIARGTSRLLGIELTVNFNVPYAATNPREFWKRWHISLSSWLRDYLYRPLGGNRGTQGQTFRNLLLTMLLGGMWHGARMNFVLWGLFQGVLLCAHRIVEPALDAITPRAAWGRRGFTFACWLVFFHLVCYGWLLFRAETTGQIVAMTTALAGGWSALPDSVGLLARVVWFSWPLLLMQYFQERSKNLLVALTWPWPVRTAVYVTIFYLSVIFGSISGEPFIYFQF